MVDLRQAANHPLLLRHHYTDDTLYTLHGGGHPKRSPVTDAHPNLHGVGASSSEGECTLHVEFVRQLDNLSHIFLLSY